VTANRGMTRRGFLISATATVGGLGAAAYGWNRFVDYELPSASSIRKGRSEVLAGHPLALTSAGKLLDTDYSDPCAGGEFLGYLPFHSKDEDEFPGRLGKLSHGGHNARLAIDVASFLTPEGRFTPNDDFFVRTEYPDKLNPPADWLIKIHGEVKKPQNVPLKSLLGSVESQGPILLECSGNAPSLKFGLLSVANFAGIPIEKIIQLAQPTEKATAILINGFDDDSHLPDNGPPYMTHSWPTCSWIFPIERIVSDRGFLATEMNGAPLPKHHGAPVRLIIPNWYGCCEVKWVNEIKFVDKDEKATWQMLEFSKRTGQETHKVPGFIHPLGPPLARDYRPGTMSQSVLPVRVEQWKVGGKLLYRIVGIMWGGPQRTEKLKIRFLGPRSSHAAFTPVQFCKATTSNPAYGIWTQCFSASRPEFCLIQVRLNDSTVKSARQDSGLYDRGLFVPEV
jgi:DMSO/TMAO reductase YedYZ molybdopterin-dependent catalytic subunit